MAWTSAWWAGVCNATGAAMVGVASGGWCCMRSPSQAKVASEMVALFGLPMETSDGVLDSPGERAVDERAGRAVGALGTCVAGGVTDWMVSEG